MIDLRNMTSLVGAGGNEWLLFRAESGGTILLGDIDLTEGRARFEADGTGSEIIVGGNMRLMHLDASVVLTPVSTLKIAGDFWYTTQTEANIDLADGIVIMNGTTDQQLEVAGEDLGLPSGVIPANFQIGQLVVGESGQATTVNLAEEIDNGNRGAAGEPEALYLGSFPSVNGLQVLAGSTLVLNGLNVYAVRDGAWLHLNLEEPGYNVFEYDGGGDIRKDLRGDLNCDGAVNGFDISLFVLVLAGNEPYGDYYAHYPNCDHMLADINADGLVNGFDIDPFVELLTGG